MRRLLHSVLIPLGMLLLSMGVYAQEKTVTGVVTSGGDASLLPEVTVTVKETGKATLTDA